MVVDNTYTGEWYALVCLFLALIYFKDILAGAFDFVYFCLERITTYCKLNYGTG
jgi:hypothetical protein